jgi:hypothetical protein
LVKEAPDLPDHMIYRPDYGVGYVASPVVRRPGPATPPPPPTRTQAEIDQEQAENRAEDERVWAQEEEEEEQREWERGEALERHWRRQISQYNADRAANANAVAAANANAVAAAQVPVDTPAPAGHAPMSFSPAGKD